jgi:hypothetical protein
VVLGVGLTILLFPIWHLLSAIAGLVVGLVARGATIRPIERIRWSRVGYRRRLVASVGWGVLAGVALGTIVELSDWLNPPECLSDQGLPIECYPVSHNLVTVLRSLLGFGLFGGLVAGLVGGFLASELSPRQITPNQGIRRSARRALLIWLSVGLLFVIPFTIFDAAIRNANLGEVLVGLLSGISIGPILYAPVALPIVLWAGGRAALQHLVLRLLLTRNQAAPWKYVRFLDEATDRLLLRKVGGGYVFVHRLLLDYFADLQSNGAAGSMRQASHPTPAR